MHPKNEVDFLKRKIESLEIKASVNEKNLQQIEKIYKNIFNSTYDKEKPQNQPFNPQNQINLEVFKDFKLPKSYEKQCEWFSEQNQKSKSSDIEASLSDPISIPKHFFNQIPQNKGV